MGQGNEQLLAASTGGAELTHHLSLTSSIEYLGSGTYNKNTTGIQKLASHHTHEWVGKELSRYIGMLRRCRSLRIAYQFGSTTPSLFSLRTPTATTSAFLDSARYRLLRMNSSITVQTSNHDRQRRQDKEVKPIYFGPFEVTSQV